MSWVWDTDAGHGRCPPSARSPPCPYQPQHPSGCSSCPNKRRRPGRTADMSVWKPPAAPCPGAIPRMGDPRGQPLAPAAADPTVTARGAGAAAGPVAGRGPTPVGGPRGRGPAKGGGAYSRFVSRPQPAPIPHWPTRAYRRREANQGEVPAPGRRSLSPYWRIKGKLRQRGSSCPPRAPRRLQPLPQRPRGPDPAASPGREPQLLLGLPSQGPGRPVGRPMGGSSPMGSGPVSTLVLPTLALAAPQAGGQQDGQRSPPTPLRRAE